MLLLIVAACAAPDPAPAEQGATPYVYDGEPEGRSPLDLDELSPAIEVAIQQLARVDPMLLHAGHSWAMGHGDGSCPEMQEHNGQDLWWGDGTTETGTLFQGFSLHTQGWGFEQAGEWVDHYLWFHAHMLVEIPGGDSFLALGDNELRGVVGPEGRRSQDVYLLGDFRWSDDPATSTWLQDELSVWLNMTAAEVEGGHSFAADGGLSQLPGTIRAMELSEVSLSEAPGACPLEPAGELSVWEPTGGWYELRFDGADDSGQATDNCDGCGILIWKGEELGELCPDFSSWLSWELWRW